MSRLDTARKAEIVKLFEKTRSKQEIDKTHTENLRKLVESYVRHTFGERFDISINGEKQTLGDLPYNNVYFSDTGIAIKYMYTDGSNFSIADKIAITEGLAMFVIDEYRQKRKGDVLIDFPENEHHVVTYFASELLGGYANMENGAILRSCVTMSKKDIIDSIGEFRQDYDRAKVAHSAKIDAIIKDIFNHPNGVVLRCEMQDAEKYLPDLHPSNLTKCKLVLDGTVKKLGIPTALCRYRKVSWGFELVIEHNEIAFLKKWAKTRFSLTKDTEVDKEVLRTIRMFIEHELSHAILGHILPGDSKSTDLISSDSKIEAEATFLSLILISWREWIYSLRFQDPKEGISQFRSAYTEWCNVYSEYYKGWGDDWVKSVTEYPVERLMTLFDKKAQRAK